MFQFIIDLLQHCLGIGQHFIVPEAKYPIASFDEKVSPPFVCLKLVGMVTAIKLDHQPLFRAEEVNDVATDGLLPAELGAVHLSAPKVHPQFPLGVGLIATEAVGVDRGY